MAENIQLSKIRTDGGTQSRVELSMFVVDEYAGHMQNGVNLPPLDVFHDGASYWLADGFHRYFAARQADWAEIPCTVHQGTVRDAILFAVGSNSGHGLRRTNADKRKAVELLLKDPEWSRWSDSDIARHASVSQPFVSGIRASLITVISERSYTTKHGTTATMNTSRIGKPAPPVAEKLPAEVRSLIRDLPAAEDKSTVNVLSKLKPEAQLHVINKALAEGEHDIKKAIRAADLEQQRESIEKGSVSIPTGLFQVISMDPPWPYGTEYDPEGRRVANPYPEMSLEEIASLEVPSAENCILWLWTTHKFLRHSFTLLDKWGFRDVAILTWAKNKMGTGSWLRSQSEFCIMAVKGSPKVLLTNQTTVLEAPLREHSRKPEEFYTLVESLCPGRKLDYFSREQREGWEQFGNDTERF